MRALGGGYTAGVRVASRIVWLEVETGVHPLDPGNGAQGGYASDRTHDLSQLRRSQRGVGLTQRVFRNWLPVRR